jgi:hypothetical protein
MINFEVSFYIFDYILKPKYKNMAIFNNFPLLFSVIETSVV